MKQSQRIRILAGLVPALLVLFGSGCRSVQEINLADVPHARLPVIRALASRVVGSGAGAASEDFKLRDAPTDRIRIVYRPLRVEGAGTIQEVAFLKLRVLLSFPDVEIVEAPAELAGQLNPPGPAAWPFLKEKRIDAIARVTPEMAADGNGGVLVLTLLDPYDGAEFGTYRQSFRVVRRSYDRNHQADFYRASRRYQFLNERSDPMVSFVDANTDTVMALLKTTVTGKLTVQSTSPETQVVLVRGQNRVALGQTPISGHVLPEGRYQLQFSRRGQDTQTRDLQVRAGRTREMFVSWPDDRAITTLSLLSYPPGQRASLDGVVRGTTPVYITDLVPGSYNVEFAQSIGDGRFGVGAKAMLEVAAGEQRSRVFFRKYNETFGSTLLDGDAWHLTSEEGSVTYDGSDGLSFRTEFGAPVWMGLASRRLVFDDCRMELEALQGPGNVLLFGLLAEDGESLLVKLAETNYSVLRFVGDELQRPIRSFVPTSQENGNMHVIGIEYSRTNSTIELTLDGDTIYEGSGASFVGRAPRLVLLTLPSSADGRPLARRLEIRTGPGLYDE
ncbi:MAG: hypothetical protein H7A21_09985 [Spirochaetales bacterium]|nr:hypothetical protein [Leptospiraceae bacterium]MCP5481752.1 hypothetical protein [Spirochaetales bacterium]